MSTRRVKKADSSHLTLKKELRLKRTPAENKLWFYLRDKRFEKLKFRRQHGVGPYIVDYYCPQKSLVIEIDGDIHAHPDQIKKDEQRTDYLNKRGLQVLRYNNEDLLKNLEGVLEDLRNHMLLRSSTAP